MRSLSWLMGRDEPNLAFLGPGDGFGVLERLRREVGGTGGSQAAAQGAGSYPPVDVYETSGGIVLTAELPGISLENVDLSVDGDRLTLRGERALELPEGARFRRRERWSGAFARVLTLPASADAARIQAVYRNGILVVTVPKAKALAPRRVPVASGR